MSETEGGTMGRPLKDIDAETVRRLAVPAVQINVARQQVNQVNVGEPA